MDQGLGTLVIADATEPTPHRRQQLRHGHCRSELTIPRCCAMYWIAWCSCATLNPLGPKNCLDVAYRKYVTTNSE